MRLFNGLLILPFICGAAIGAAACGDNNPSQPADPSDPGNDPPAEPAFYSVSGVIQDTLTDERVEGALVTIAGKTDTTDFVGFYQFQDIPEGANSLMVVHDRYRPIERIISVDGATTVNLLAWPTSPVLTGFQYNTSSGEALATYMDLDGDLRTDAWGRFTGPGFSSIIQTGTYDDIDDLTRRFYFTGHRGASEISMWVYDLEDHVGGGLCTPSGSCD